MMKAVIATDHVPPLLQVVLASCVPKLSRLSGMVRANYS